MASSVGSVGKRFTEPFSISTSPHLPLGETLLEEDLKFMELLLSKNKDLVKIKKVKDEERGIETTYITIKKRE